jgi:hypothetical protein
MMFTYWEYLGNRLVYSPVVDVRIYGSVALVQATGSWIGKDNAKGISRYTDVYVKFEEQLKTVSAQITRTSQT